MKYVITLMLLYANNINAQDTGQPIIAYHYIFNEFTAGAVRMKSGEIHNQLLNYNILTSEMIFDNSGKYLAIAHPENVDTVSISNRKFIPINNKFYEVLLNSRVPLLLEFTYTIKEPGISAGYGTTTTTAATTSLKSLITRGDVYNLKLPDDFEVIPGYMYWIQTDKLEEANSTKKLIKIFPDRKKLINDLVKKNKTNFSEEADLVTLVKEIEQ